jgi:hypothetical protein
MSIQSNSAGPLIASLRIGGIVAFTRLQALFEKYKEPLAERGYKSIADVLNAGKFNLITSPVNIMKREAVKELLRELKHARTRHAAGLTVRPYGTSPIER